MTEAVAAVPGGNLSIRPAAAARLLALLLPLALLAGAFGSEYLGHLIPCEMCWWQRYAHLAALPLAALAFTGTAESQRSRALTLLAALAIAVSGAIGVYHAGVELKIFEGFTQCTANGHATLESIIKTPLIRCDQVQWSFLGISMAGWNATLSLGGAALIVLISFKASKR